MADHVLAASPQLAVASAEHEEHQAQPKENWNQEQEVHSRAASMEPESHRERFQSLLPGLDIKRLIL